MAKDKDREKLLAEVKSWVQDHPESQLVNEDLEKMATDEIRSQLEAEKFSFGLDVLSSSEQMQEESQISKEDFLGTKKYPLLLTFQLKVRFRKGRTNFCSSRALAAASEKKASRSMLAYGMIKK